jgi:hypothetical protein
MGPLAMLGPSLGSHVGHVVGLRAEEEMLRANTQPIVAVMQNVQTRGDWAYG